MPVPTLLGWWWDAFWELWQWWPSLEPLSISAAAESERTKVGEDFDCFLHQNINEIYYLIQMIYAKLLHMGIEHTEG